MSLEAFGNTVLDDLSDAPSIVVFPAGVHVCKQNWSAESKEGNVIATLTLTHVETKELATNVTLVPHEVAPNSEASVKFNMANEYGQGQLKAIVDTYREQLNLTREIPVADILATVNGSTAQFVISNRQGKAKLGDAKDKKLPVYMGIEAAMLLG